MTSMWHARGSGSRLPRSIFLGLGGALLLGPLSAPAPAAADPQSIQVATHRDAGWGNNDWDDDWGDAWQDYNRTILQMQRESLASQEEAAREAGRAARRDEIGKSRARDAAEREAYFDAVLEASQASLRAPRGVYYRKPGHTSPDPPPENTPVVEVGGIPYLYDRGIFWLRQGADYLVVTAPPGAVLDALPAAAVRLPLEGKGFWYYFGAFFAERDARYLVVPAPPGITVHYLPDGYTQEKAGGADVYRFGDTLFKPVFIQGVLAYQVVAKP